MMVEEAKAELDSLADVDPSVSAAVHYVSSLYYKVRCIAPVDVNVTRVASCSYALRTGACVGSVSNVPSMGSGGSTGHC